MAATLPLSALLSQALVAYTIEFDNEAERRVTALKGRPWFLTSMPFWSNLVRLMPSEGAMTLAERERIATAAREPIVANLGGLERWGYILLRPAGEAGKVRARSEKGYGSAAGLKQTSVLSLSDAGREAQRVWRGLTGAIDKRWRARFGTESTDALARALHSVASGLDEEQPRSFPMLTYAMRIEPSPFEGPARSVRTDLGAGLAQVLVGFARAYEAQTELSLAMSANTLRVLRPEDVSASALPSMTGLSKEAISMTLTFLQKRGLIVVEPDRARGKGKLVRLTQAGKVAQDGYRRITVAVEKRLTKAHGTALRDALELLYERDQRTGRARLADGLAPHAGGWRTWKDYAAQTEAFLADPRSSLPQCPMPLHRGGWPDGS